MFPSEVLIGLPILLQWGRVLMNAETAVSAGRQRLDAGARFNGAAFS